MHKYCQNDEAATFALLSGFHFVCVKQMPSAADDISINYLSMFFGKIIKMRYSSLGPMYYHQLCYTLCILHTLNWSIFQNGREKKTVYPKLNMILGETPTTRYVPFVDVKVNQRAATIIIKKCVVLDGQG